MPSISLNNLKPKHKAKGRKRIGRGNASGHGTYSGRGQKGQNARSGVSGLKRLGFKQVLLATPKKRGFKSHRDSNQVVNLEDLNNLFKAGETVSPISLSKKGLIKTSKKPVKILSEGELKVEKLVFDNVKVSKQAEEKIKKANGEIK